MKRRTPFLALVTIAVVSPVVTWWLVGDQSEPDRPGGLDYLFRPLPLSRSQQDVIVTTAVALVATALATVLVALRRQRIRLVETRFVVPLVLVGAYCGLCWRVVTAGVIGANIGGGLGLLSLPLVLVVGTLWTVRWLPRREPSSAVDR
jgi:hypothetical protein